MQIMVIIIHECITGHNYFTNSAEDFDTEYEHCASIKHLQNFWQSGDKLHVELDMIHQKGRMWNDNDKDRIKMFEVSLPESAAILV